MELLTFQLGGVSAPYADELVWNNLKNHAVGERMNRSRDELESVVTNDLRSLQRMPEKLGSFFQQPDVCDAANAY